MVVNFSPRTARVDGSTLVERAKRLQLLVTDVDGVLTDGGIYSSDEGEQMKRFSARAGMGVERLREAGIATAIVTGERSACVQKRAEKLGITAVYLGVRRKADLLERILAENHCDVMLSLELFNTEYWKAPVAETAATGLAKLKASVVAAGLA